MSAHIRCDPRRHSEARFQIVGFREIHGQVKQTVRQLGDGYRVVRGVSCRTFERRPGRGVHRDRRQVRNRFGGQRIIQNAIGHACGELKRTGRIDLAGSIRGQTLEVVQIVGNRESRYGALDGVHEGVGSSRWIKAGQLNGRVLRDAECEVAHVGRISGTERSLQAERDKIRGRGILGPTDGVKEILCVRAGEQTNGS